MEGHPNKGGQSNQLQFSGREVSQRHHFLMEDFPLTSVLVTVFTKFSLLLLKSASMASTARPFQAMACKLELSRGCGYWSVVNSWTSGSLSIFHSRIKATRRTTLTSFFLLVILVRFVILLLLLMLSIGFPFVILLLRVILSIGLRDFL